MLEESADDQLVANGIGKLGPLNPGWTVHIWDDEGVNAFIRNTTLLTAESKALLLNAHMIERTDAFRLLVLYEMGGYYQVGGILDGRGAVPKSS